MGYLLPIHFNQYDQYQNRIMGSKPFLQTERIEKVKAAYLFQMDPTVKDHFSFSKRQNKRQVTNSEKIYAEITGIGKLFNKII